MGAFGSIAVVQAIANRDAQRPLAASLPWHLLIGLLAVVATWTLLQPMDMRGMVMPG